MSNRSQNNSSSTHNSLSILIIEPNHDHQLLIGYSLRVTLPKAQLVFASSAQKALAHLVAASVNPTHFPQLVLLEIHMPQPQKGWQLLQKLRSTYPGLPVIVLSTSQDPAYVRQAYELGAHSFMGKPDNLEAWEQHFSAFRRYWFKMAILPS